MKVSIIIPSFNQAAYLEAAIQSAVDQSHPNTEVIVMDGGSTDGSTRIIERYASRLAHFEIGADGGQANAIRKGFGLASGNIIGWVNSDDVLAPGAIERVARAAGENGSPDCVFYGGCEVIDSDGEVQEVLHAVHTVPWIARTIGPVLTQPGTFFGRNAYLRAGEVDPSLKYAMDLDLWVRLARAAVPFVRISAIQGQFRSHSMQKGHSLQWIRTCIAEEEEIRRRHGLAPTGSRRRNMALQLQRVVRLVTGRVASTLAFRLIKRRRLRPFAVDFAA